MRQLPEDPAIETGPRFEPELLPADVSPEDTLYVVDRRLNVVYGNQGWDGFASRNGGSEILQDQWDSNLLMNMSGATRQRWERIYRLLLEGAVPGHREEMICSSPVEKRLYQFRITPIRNGSGEVTWLVHHAARVDRGDSPRRDLSRRLSKLEHPVESRQEFQDHIARRPIRLSRLRVETYLQPLEEVGGDLIWHREYSSSACDLVHADVMGHGEKASLVAVQLAAVLDDLGRAELGPAEIVARLNHTMLEIIPEDDVVFATGLVFRIQADRRRVTCCSFGHTGPIFSRTGPLVLDVGLPVGLCEEEGPWPETQLDLEEHGTRFVVFSDGITEQFNHEGEMFALEGLARAFRTYLDLPLDEMLTSLLVTLQEFRGSALVKDDQTLLAIEAGDSAL